MPVFQTGIWCSDSVGSALENQIAKGCKLNNSSKQIK